MSAEIFSSGVVVSTQKKSRARRKRTTLVIGRLLDTYHSSASLQSAISKGTWNEPTRAWEDEIQGLLCWPMPYIRLQGPVTQQDRRASFLLDVGGKGLTMPMHIPAQTKKGLVLNYGMHIYL